MKRTTKYVGFDVHQATVVTSVRDDTGRVIHRAVLETSVPAIVEYLRGMRGSIHLAIEEGTQAQWLHDELQRYVDRIVVFDSRGEKRSGSKGDYGDADRASDGLRMGRLRPVYHGGSKRLDLKELSRTYRNLVDDHIRVMQRIKALFRARGMPTKGQSVYSEKGRKERIEQLPGKGVQSRLRTLYAQHDLLRTLRPEAKNAMIAEARRDRAWKFLKSIPFLGPVRVALLLAILDTPWRFRAKRSLWAYSGLAVVTWTSAEHEFVSGRPVRRKRAPMTRGLNKNHNPVMKDLFKATAIAAASKPGPLKDFCDNLIVSGMDPEMARLTLARKIAAVTLRLWKKGELFDPSKLTMQST